MYFMLNTYLCLKLFKKIYNYVGEKKKENLYTYKLLFLILSKIIFVKLRNIITRVRARAIYFLIRFLGAMHV